jgi:hypothetical protein
MRVKILSKCWTFMRVKELHQKGGAYGQIEHPSKKGKTLKVDDSLTDRHELEIIIHEFLHGADWSKDEEWIEETSEDLSRFLWRLGYRKCES